MRSAKIFVNKQLAGRLIEVGNSKYKFCYEESYEGQPVSLTMPTKQREFDFNTFPPFFEGVLPEGQQLEALLRLAKLDRQDYFGQLIQVGGDLVGAISVEAENP